MDYLSAFEISASGMAAEKARVDAVALNLANVNSTRGPDGVLYRPLTVITNMRSQAAKFDGVLDGFMGNRPTGVEVIEVRPSDTPPRLVYQPGHPHADANGFVAFPNINPAAEMITLMDAVRSYEANVKTLNAAKAMATKALEIGRMR